MSTLFRNFALEIYFSRWEFHCKHHMTASDAESMRLPELLAYASAGDRADFENLHLGYTQTYGAPELRDVIASIYDSVKPENILCFAGAEEGIYVAMQCLLNADDHVIVITPNYQAAETLPLGICDVTGVALDPDKNWDLDVAKIKDAIRPNTKLISINFPNNPTGKIISHQQMAEIVALCRAQGIWLFSDEVYRLIERDPAIRLPQAVDIYERGISLNVMSKAYGLPGLRIGWLACKDKDMLIKFERYKHFLSICNSAPSEVLARIALKARDKILARNRGIVRDNINLMNSFFADFPHLFDWKEPDGSCVGFIRYKGREGVETFAQRIVEEAGVLLLPSSIYKSDIGSVPQDHFRIGFGRKNVADGLTAMRNWLTRNAA